MKRLLFFLLLCQCVIVAQAQITVKDIDDRLPIGDVIVMDAEGNVLGLTNADGQLPETATTHRILSLQHVAYTTMTVDTDTVREQTIWMQTQVRDIAEVVVDAPRYMQLRGYFRAYQMVGNKMEFFDEGYHDFVLDLKSKDKFRFRMQARQRYANATLPLDDDTALSKMGLLLASAAPRMGNSKVADAVRHLAKDDTSSNIRMRNPKTGYLYASITTDTVHHTQTAIIDGLMNRNDTTYSNFALKTLARMIGVKNFRILKIKHAEVYDSDSIRVSRSEMTGMHNHYKASYKIKEEDSTRIVDVYLDFYVTERNQLSKEEYKKLRKEKFNAPAKFVPVGIPVLPEALQRQRESLVLRKK